MLLKIMEVLNSELFTSALSFSRCSLLPLRLDFLDFLVSFKNAKYILYALNAI